MSYKEPTQTPWTFDQVRAALEHHFADTPYAVTSEGGKIRIEADLADTVYLSWANGHHVNEVRGVEIAAKKNGKATTRDYSFSVALSARSAKQTSEINYASGRQWSLEKSIEYGVGDDGKISRQGGYTFSTSEIQRPVNDILKRSGWYAGPLGSLSTDARIGAIVAILTVVGLLVAGLVVLVMSLS